MATQNIFQQALQFHQAGRLAEAETYYRKALEQNPNNADAYNLMGILDRQRGRHDAAIEWIRKAISLNRYAADFHFNLGEALRALSRLDEAVASYQKAIDFRNNDFEVWHALGTALRRQEKLDPAAAAFRRAIQLNPRLLPAYDDLAECLLHQGNLPEALAMCRRALELHPGRAEGHYNIAAVLAQAADFETAAAAYLRATQLRPDWAEAHLGMAAVMDKLGRRTDAIAACRRAIALKPDYAEAYNLLGLGLDRQAKQAEAIAAYREALRLRPAYPEAYSNLANTLKDQGLLDEALAAHRSALELQPDLATARSNYLLSLNYDAKADERAVFAEHVAFGTRHAQRLADRSAPPSNMDHSPERRLRIGYVSADFREHPVATFMEPVLANHDQHSFEIVCYCDVPRADAVTRRLQSHVSRWHATSELTDEQLADRIRKDGIDILVDLAGHTAFNRLLVFARRPAPIAMSYLGYPNTTGLPRSCMQWRLTDALADPQDMTDSLYTEQLLRLPGCFLCYQPPTNAPDVVAPPCDKDGRITFGSLNQFAKVTSTTIDIWCRLLAAVPGSRLLLKAKGLAQESTRQIAYSAFAARGIAAEQLVLAGYEMTPWDHLARYNQIDIALDTFPYHGTTTSCEAMWMGVPVVTLAGQTHRSRVGVSLLSAVGLGELITFDAEAYVDVASKLAQTPARLRQLRTELRPRIKASPLTDANTFVRNLENGYRTAWRSFCASAAC